MTPPKSPSYRFGSFRLDRGERLLYEGDQPVPLTPRAVDTLLALVERHGRLVTKEELMREVWHDTFVEENNLAQHISMLRRVLSRSGDGPFIETVPKRGYRFAMPVTQDIDEPRVEVAPAIAPASGPTPPPVAPTVRPEDIRSERRRPWSLWPMAAVSVLLVAGLAWSVAGRQRSSAPGSHAEAARGSADPGLTRIAVLPFENLGDPREQYFAAGVTEEITSRLASLSMFSVVSSTSSREYDRRGKTVSRIAADLGVTHIVEGSVLWRDSEGGRLRLIPKLIRAADDVTIWTHQYDAERGELLPVQAEIAERIAGALHTSMNADDRRAISSRPTSDPDAYLAYLRGITAFQQSWSDTALQAQARRELEDAVGRDPRFALAWTWLAQVYATQYNSGADRSPATRAAALDAARRAIELSPGLPEAHLAYARILMMLDRDYDGALKALEVARAGLQNSPDVLRVGAAIQQRRGRFAESLALQTRAFEIDPAGTSDLLAIHYLHTRQYDESRRFIEVANSASRLAAAVPEAWGLFSASGEVQGARAVLERALTSRLAADARVRGLLSRLEWFDGRYDRALELIGQMDPAGAWWAANFRFPAAIAAGQVYESLGQRQLALEQYESALATLERRARETPDDYQVEAAMGLAAAGMGRADEAVRHAARAVELLPLTRDGVEGPVYLYTLAVVQARVGRHDEAFATLHRLFAAPGFYNEQWIRRDPWFASLREHADFPRQFQQWSRMKGATLLGRSRVDFLPGR